jgi:hypothetical protein
MRLSFIPVHCSWFVWHLWFCVVCTAPRGLLLVPPAQPSRWHKPPTTNTIARKLTTMLCAHYLPCCWCCCSRRQLQADRGNLTGAMSSLPPAAGAAAGRPLAFITCGLHAREVLASELCYWLVRALAGDGEDNRPPAVYSSSTPHSQPSPAIPHPTATLSHGAASAGGHTHTMPEKHISRMRATVCVM